MGNLIQKRADKGLTLSRKDAETAEGKNRSLGGDFLTGSRCSTTLR
jgi:hypothetical protein